MNADHITWFAFGSAATSVLYALTLWIAGRVGRVADAYDTAVPLTREELARRREKMTQSLLDSTPRVRAQ